LSYHKYLCSSHWLKFRQQALDYYGKKCADCGTEHARFDVHHLTYDRIGEELLGDVVILCHDCHTARHEKGNPVHCSHQTLSHSIVTCGGSTHFWWYCKDCQRLVCLREPTDKELINAELLKQKHEKWCAREFEKQQIRDKKKAERLVAKKEADRLAGKKKRPKPLKKIKRKAKV